VNERTLAELQLVRSVYPLLEFREGDGWARLPSFPTQADLWDHRHVEVAFRFPELPGQPPYGFWVRPGLALVSGTTIQNYSYPVATPFGDGYGQFSWSPDEWRPAADVRLGSNMLHWLESFKARLAEGA